MSPATLARSARRFRTAALCASGALVVMLGATLTKPSTGVLLVNAGTPPRPYAAAVAAVVVGLAAAALIELSRMLRIVEAGQMFSPAATRHLRRFALMFLLSSSANIVLSPLMQVALAVWNAGGRVTLEIDDGGLLALLIGAFLFLVARLLDEGGRLEEDARSII